MSESPPIRPAATVVLIRGTLAPEVLLLLRHAEQGFLAGVWVFPGGRVGLSDGQDEIGARRAAVRETWEEAGILLRDPVRVALPGEPRQGDWNGAERWPLWCFARWVTPAGVPRRFDTRFFVTRVASIEAVPDQSEVTEALWLDPGLALERHRAGGLPLAPPTYWALEAMRRLGTPEAMEAWAIERERAGVTPLHPSLAFEQGAMVVGADTSILPLPPGEPVSGRLELISGVWHPIA